jgi:hypothetical protein
VSIPAATVRRQVEWGDPLGYSEEDADEVHGEEEDMKYLLAFVRNQDEMYEGTEEDMRKAMDAWNEFDREAIEAGVLIANEALELPNTARTVRMAEEGEPAVTDGPFTETKEQLGGFCLIDCESLEEAIGWAKKVPMRPGSKAGAAAIEVRQVRDLSAYGYVGATPAPIEAKA